MTADKTITMEGGDTINIEIDAGRIELRVYLHGERALGYLNAAEAREIAATLNAASLFVQ